VKKFVFIASLRHSGSTLLDLILGGHPRFIGLGEVARVVKPDGIQQTETRGSICSCGKTIHDCVFWGEVASRLRGLDNSNFAERYEVVLDVFENIFGQSYIPVDSSKYLYNLEVLKKLDLDIKVLHVIKDVRSFTISQVDNHRRKTSDRWRYHHIKYSPAYIFWRWYSQNKKMQNFFTDQNMQVFQIGYEELCLYPKLMIQQICEFLEEDVELSMLTLKESQSHVMRGNRMRTQKDKTDISYDHRWFFRNEWIIPAFLFPHIMRYNAREVYRNHTGALWGQ
jgi:hypothetical protein